MLAGHSIIKHALDAGTWTVHRDGLAITSHALKIGPHSVDVSLGGKFVTARRAPIVCKAGHITSINDFNTPLLDPYVEDQQQIEWTTVEADYYDLMPHSLILGYVRERFDSSKPVETKALTLRGRNSVVGMLGEPRYFTQLYDGRSTMGRIGIMSHLTAGYGDLGFGSNFTLEIFNANANIAVRLHRGMRIGQISFDDVANIEDPPKMYDGSYVHQHDKPVPPVLGWKKFVQPGEIYSGAP
jgi:deoxycytidine triphosphate deaminase